MLGLSENDGELIKKAEVCDLEGVESALKAGGKPYAYEVYDWSALRYAVKYENVEILKLLIQNYYDVWINEKKEKKLCELELYIKDIRTNALPGGDVDRVLDEWINKIVSEQNCIEYTKLLHEKIEHRCIEKWHEEGDEDRYIEYLNNFEDRYGRFIAFFHTFTAVVFATDLSRT